MADRDWEGALAGTTGNRDAVGVFVGDDLVGEIDLARSRFLIVSWN